MKFLMLGLEKPEKFFTKFIVNTSLQRSDLGGRAMTNNAKPVCANIAFVFFTLFVVCINLNARVRVLETSNDELQQTIRTQNDGLEKAKEKNTMQDVIINKLNNDYNSRMAQQLQEVADENGVGG